MSINYYSASKRSTIKLPFLLNVAAVLLGITSPAVSQTDGRLPNNIAPHRFYVAQTQNTPASGQPQRPATAGQSRATYRFTFTTSLEYSKCLDDILLLYENKAQFQERGRQSNCLAETFQANSTGGFSKAQARQMIDFANRYATTLLKPGLYPPRGQRERIAGLLGFVYEIDKNDQEIRQLATQGLPPVDPPVTEEPQPADDGGGGW
ncbi:hypothetical protein [Aerosakkonema funiforme]|nr:hypothetical protein [Aerosakkonema funiforme]